MKSKVLELERADIGEICNTTFVTYYSVLDYLEGSVLSNQGVYPSKAIMKCNNCKQEGLSPSYSYCPNCGRKIISSLV